MSLSDASPEPRPLPEIAAEIVKIAMRIDGVAESLNTSLLDGACSDLKELVIQLRRPASASPPTLDKKRIADVDHQDVKLLRDCAEWIDEVYHGGRRPDSFTTHLTDLADRIAHFLGAAAPDTGDTPR